MSNNQILNSLGIEEELVPWMEHYLEWHKENVKEVISSEQTLVHKDGYGGTTDLLCVLKDGSRAIVDYKTQGVKEDAKPRFYDSWIYQLVAYRACFPDPDNIKCVSVILNSSKPEPLTHKVWSKKEVEGAKEIFWSALKIWQGQKKFKPNI